MKKIFLVVLGLSFLSICVPILSGSKQEIPVVDQQDANGLTPLMHALSDKQNFAVINILNKKPNLLLRSSRTAQGFSEGANALFLADCSRVDSLVLQAVQSCYKQMYPIRFTTNDSRGYQVLSYGLDPDVLQELLSGYFLLGSYDGHQMMTFCRVLSYCKVVSLSTKGAENCLSAIDLTEQTKCYNYLGGCEIPEGSTAILIAFFTEDTFKLTSKIAQLCYEKITTDPNPQECGRQILGSLEKAYGVTPMMVALFSKNEQLIRWCYKNLSPNLQTDKIKEWFWSPSLYRWGKDYTYYDLFKHFGYPFDLFVRLENGEEIYEPSCCLLS